MFRKRYLKAFAIFIIAVVFIVGLIYANLLYNEKFDPIVAEVNERVVFLSFAENPGLCDAPSVNLLVLLHLSEGGYLTAEVEDLRPIRCLSLDGLVALAVETDAETTLQEHTWMNSRFQIHERRVSTLGLLNNLDERHAFLQLRANGEDS